MKARRRQRPQIEAMERRLLMAMVAVTNINDSGAGSLRDAIASAQSGDTIDLSQISGTILLTGGEIPINTSLTLTGPGTQNLTLDGDNAGRIFNIASGATVSVSDLTLKNGNSGTEGGGAIYSQGALTLTRVSFLDNTGALRGGAVDQIDGSLVVSDSTFSADHVIYNGTENGIMGGGIYAESCASTITGSTFSSNTADGRTLPDSNGNIGYGGGAMFLYGSAALNNCTFDSNTVVGSTNTSGVVDYGSGAGLVVCLLDSATITNCTIVRNQAHPSVNLQTGTADAAGGGIYAASCNPVLINNLIVQNTAQSSLQVFVDSGTFSGGGNIIDANDGAVPGLTDGQDGNQLERAVNVDALADNGGPTLTVQPDRTAVRNLGIDSPDVLPHDQRGIPRSGAPDVGAYEFINNVPSFTTTAPTDSVADSVYTYKIAAHDDDYDSLAITAPTLPSWLSFTDNGEGTATLTGTASNANAGANEVVLRVSDGIDVADQSFTITVEYVNHSPQFDSDPLTLPIISRTPLNCLVRASDIDGDALTITAPVLPAWITLHDNGDGTALLSGTPTDDDGGINDLTLRVSDGVLSTDQSSSFVVAAPRFQLDGGVLTIAGGIDDDDIHIWIRGTDQVRAVYNGLIKNFSLSAINQVEVYGFDGDDTLTVNMRTTPTYVLGGAGDDMIQGYDEPDNLVGGGGKDYIDAGANDDRLDGGNGKDTLIGGDGNDRLYGGDDNDVLVGGSGSDEFHAGGGDDLLYARDSEIDSLWSDDGQDRAQIDNNDVLQDSMSLLA